MKTKNQKLLEEINEAFARNDLDFILGHVTDTIRWEIVGEQTVVGKEASVNGEMKTADGEVYAFCDVYKFSGFKNPKIVEMTSYVVDITDNK